MTHHSQRSISRILTPAVLGLCTLMLLGASPLFWRVSTQDEFLRGVVNGLSVDAAGHLVLGPRNEPTFDTSAPALWSLARSGDGSMWIGTGSEGRLYRVAPDGSGNVIFDADELDVHAVVSDQAGGVFAATSPDGRVYRVTPDGESTSRFDPDARYIWDMDVAQDGTLYVATGDPARVYRVPPDGQAVVAFESDATHVLTVSVAADNALLIGTESPGQVLRIAPEGRAFVLLDTPFDEIRTVRPQPDGSILVVAVSGQSGSTRTAPPPVAAPTSATPTPTVSVTTSVTAVVVADTTGSSSSGSSAAVTSTGREQGAVYRIDPDGLWHRLWRSNEDTPFDAVFDSQGHLLVGTGPDGKLFQVTSNPTRTILLGRAPARQITRFLRLPDGSLRYGTANPGRIMRLGADIATRGTYESDIHDATTVARWGTLRWRSRTPTGSRVELSTRSGNTAIPNDTWSDWSDPYTNRAGAQILSPNARYLQWRATLSAGDASPVLTSVTAAYLPRNIRPEVTELTVHPPGTMFQQAFSSGDPPVAGLGRRGTDATPGTPTTLGRQSYKKGLQTFVWRARDENRDRLEYSLSYQRDGEPLWHELASGLRETVFAWDTSTVPDGAYRIQLAVTDAPSSAPDTALVGERQSPIFIVDNSAPEIDVDDRRRTNGRRLLVFTVRDTQSPIQSVEVSEGMNLWRTVYPIDGIPDGLVERFEVILNGDGDSVPIIRANDALNNGVTVPGR